MLMTVNEKKTHFGYQDVNWEDKQEKVREVFQSVAPHYDIMNDLMSFGVHRLWKRFTIDKANIRPGQCILDLAGGSGDLAHAIYKRLKGKGVVILSDINADMLNIGRNRMIDEGMCENIDFIQADAQNLPFAKNSFDCVTMAFGLRNVTDKECALRSIKQTLKPGGKVMVLEFSKPKVPGLKPIYDAYSFGILPKVGKLIANDEESYRYLAESIRMHPCQEDLKNMMESAGFEDCHYYNLTGGIVALHIGYHY
jgi:demethylmenaquinone methyltransferase / 2-methoxy-6-polyprenyl-1,4-benzoquinol methylase